MLIFLPSTAESRYLSNSGLGECYVIHDMIIILNSEITGHCTFIL